MKNHIDGIQLLTLTSALLVVSGLVFFFGAMPEGKMKGFYGFNSLRKHLEEEWDQPLCNVPLIFRGVTVNSDIWRMKYITFRNRCESFGKEQKHNKTAKGADAYSPPIPNAASKTTCRWKR